MSDKKLVVLGTKPTAITIFSDLLLTFLRLERHAYIRGIYGLRQDVPYVAGVVADLFLPVDPQGFQPFASLTAARNFFLNPANSPGTAWDARTQADRLLLVLGGVKPSRVPEEDLLPLPELEALRAVGPLLYGLAAENAPDPEREDLESMAMNFEPWTEVLPEFFWYRPPLVVL